MSRIDLMCAVAAINLFISQPSVAAGGELVFYLDETNKPIVQIDRLGNFSPGMKALLAVYSLENGAGCEGKDEAGLVRCALTEQLGLGSNCSERHIELVRAWFKRTPNLTSRWDARRSANTKKPNSLESLCYRQPDTASWHNVWEQLRVKEAGRTVSIDAVLAWGSQYGHGCVRYRNVYKIGRSVITEVSSSKEELSRSTDNIFGGQKQ